MSTNTAAEIKTSPVTPEQFDKFLLVLGGHIFFQTLSAAVQLDLFGLLKSAGPLTREQIATRLKIDEQPARILLLGCTTLGLIRKEGQAFSNSSLADQLLVRDVPGNVVSIIEWQHFINYRPMYSFCEAIKANKNVGLDVLEGTEKTLYERLVHSPQLELIFQQAMQSISVQANQLFAENVDLSKVKRLVDVGGGNGTNALTLARKFPHLRATVFDSPSVCEIAKENIRQSGLADRVDTFAGECFKDSFPTGADCFVFSHFMTIWSAQKNRQLLHKACDALPKGGRCIVFNMMQHDDETGPLTAAIGSPYFLALATGEGMLYTWSEYESWMREAGFSQVSRQQLPRDHGVIIGTK